MERRKVFISYSHKDAKYRQELVKHLSLRKDLLEIWADSQIDAGDLWYDKIKAAMESCRLAILLISVDFLNSPFVLGEEVPTLLRRQREEGLTLYPLLVGYCAWEQVDWLERRQMRPEGLRPLEGQGPAQRNKILSSVAREVHQLMQADPQPVGPVAAAAGKRVVAVSQQLPEYIYCATAKGVGLNKTRALLTGPYRAIWFPRPQYSRRRLEPEPGARVWLVWRRDKGEPAKLLGVGHVKASNEGSVAWTNRTLPGVRPAAEALGYGGPTNMTFLHLDDLQIWDEPTELDLGDISSGLSVAGPKQIDRLRVAGSRTPSRGSEVMAPFRTGRRVVSSGGTAPPADSLFRQGEGMAVERREVTQSGKDEDGDITALCNPAEGWSPRSKAGAIADIDSKQIEYYSGGAKVYVRDHRKHGKYLTTGADASKANNLDNLPDCD